MQRVIGGQISTTLLSIHPVQPHPSIDAQSPGRGIIALVGQPNVGKSALFQRLTGQRVVISNYPGTTVEILRGQSQSLSGEALVDTPGIVSFPSITEDEQVTERVLLEEPIKAILQVGDAKNLRRTLLMTIQLAEMGIPVVLALNMSDEAEARGLSIDHTVLSTLLGIPVIPTIATQKKGMGELTQAFQNVRPVNVTLSYSLPVEDALNEIAARLSFNEVFHQQVSLRALAVLWLCEDRIIEEWMKDRLSEEAYQDLIRQRDAVQTSIQEPLAVTIQRVRMETAQKYVEAALRQENRKDSTFAGRLGDWTLQPVSGLLILSLVLLAIYGFVGLFGAGILVELLEGKLFGELINPRVISLITRLVPFPLVVDFLVGPFGLWTMGITYALGLILPIVTTFFITFSIMEDSGYLPRLAALTNRMFATLGLNGRAVLPMVLGLGCVTMATITTRIMESKRERLLVTLLLALAVPCSAQLGVVMGMLAGVSFSAMLIWSGVVFGVMLVIGWLAARLVPGERSPLLVELPPLRWPLAPNVLTKTLLRLEWYLKEVIPLFLIGAAVMFFLDISGVLTHLIHAAQPLVTGWLGLPPQASAALLMGFLRRDFGATGLFVLQSDGMLTPVQIVVAMVTITLFIPCVASLMMIARERGWRSAVAMFVLIVPLAFLVGGLLERFLIWTGWGS